MARNVRALKLKENASELETKLRDIKRLVGALKNFIWESVSSAKPSGCDMIEATAQFGADLEVRARYSFRINSDDAVRFELWHGDKPIKSDSQFDLKTVRRVHENLDVLIELAESICEDAGRLAKFQAKMKRFEV